MSHDAINDHARHGVEQPRKHHVCPWWVGYLLASPIRKLGENPETILAPHVRPGMVAVDIGCAMGFFSLPLARMVGGSGRVHCLDIQDRMLRSLERRARRTGLEDIILPRRCSQEDLGLADLAGSADLVLAVHVVHETTYPQRFLLQCHDVLTDGGILLLIEPNGHVTDAEFDRTRDLALAAGFSERSLTLGARSRRMVLEK